MYCNQCGKEIPDGTRFCSFCGCSQIPAPKKPVCPACGHELDAQAEFCGYCGTKMNVQQGSGQAQATQAPSQGTPAKSKPNFLIFIILAVVIGGCFLFFNNSKQGDLKRKQELASTYINDVIPTLEKEKDEIVNNLISFYTGGDMSATNLLQRAQTLSISLVGNAMRSDVTAGVGAIGVVANAKGAYVEFAKTTQDAVDTLLSAFQTNDADKAKLGIAMLKDADALYSKFQKELKYLADEYDVGYTKSSALPFEKFY